MSSDKQKFRQIQEKLKILINHTKKQDLEKGVNITDPRYKEVLILLEDKILEKLGMGREEYETLKKQFNIKKPLSYNTLVDVPEIPVLPTKEEIQQIAKEVLPQPVNTTTVVNKIVKETIKEKPQIIKEVKTIEKLDNKQLDELGKDIRTLQADFSNFIGQVGQDIKVSQDFMAGFDGMVGTTVRDLISPELNRIARSFQSQIYQVQQNIKQFESSENIWDISGTSIIPHSPTYTGYNLDMGTGSIIADGGFLSEGNINGYTIPSGAGSRFMWIPSKWSIRAGSANADEWDLSNIGAFTFAFGQNIKLPGAGSGGEFASGNNINIATDMGFGFGNALTSTGSDYVFLTGNGLTTAYSDTYMFGDNYTAPKSGFYYSLSGVPLLSINNDGFNIGNQGFFIGTNGAKLSASAGILTLQGQDVITTTNPAGTPSGVINYTTGSWTNYGLSHIIRVYAYKDVGGTLVFSSDYIQSNVVTDNGLDDDLYHIVWSWNAVAGADGYRILKRMYYGGEDIYNYDRYADVATNSLVDDYEEMWIEGSDVTPTSVAGNREDLSLDFSQDNKIAFSSSTGATLLDFGSLNLSTTGTLGAGTMNATWFGSGLNNENTARYEALASWNDGDNIQGLRIESTTAGGITEELASTTIAFSTFVTGDSFVRFTFLANGKLEWGSGNLVADTNLYRYSANTLKTDDTFIAGNIYTAGSIGIGTGASTPATSFHLSGTTSAHYAQIDTGINFDTVAKATGAITATLVATETGNVTAGDHRYVVTFVTALGETEINDTASNTVTADATHKQVNLTGIPVSTDYRVIARRIYRTIATSPLYHYKLLYEIPDNTTTTYTDNTADGSLTGGSNYPGYYYKDNTTNKFVLVDGVAAMYLGQKNTTFGIDAGSSIVAPGYNNAVFGYWAGKAITTGNNNTLIGHGAGQRISSGQGLTAIGMGAGIHAAQQNTFVGSYAGSYVNASGGNNVAVGAYSLRHSSYAALTTGSWNVAMGDFALAGAITSASANVAIGGYTGFATTTGSNSVFLGYAAGKYETAGAKLFIDGYDRTNEATGRTNSLIYGTFAAAVASQQLTVNAGTLNFNAGVDTDLTINFIGTTTSGLLNWMEDEDYFKFSDDILMNSTEAIYFRDTALYINSPVDGVLNLTADSAVRVSANWLELPILEDDPVSEPADGRCGLFYNSSTNEIKGSIGSGWVTIFSFAI